MSARAVIEHALRVYYADSRDPSATVGRLLAQYDEERDADREKSSREAIATPHRCPACHRTFEDCTCTGGAS